MNINIKLAYFWYLNKDKYYDTIEDIQQNDPLGYKPTGIVTKFTYFWDRHAVRKGITCLP